MNEYDIRSMTLEELQAVMEKIGEKPFKAKQIYQWLHEKCAADYEEMTNISRGLRERLAEAYPLSWPQGCGGADFQNRRDAEISVSSGRWKCGGECSDALSPWKLGLHFFPGGL